jgi:hypothetical protein
MHMKITPHISEESHARFSEHYARLRALGPVMARERSGDTNEDLVQAIWYDQLFRAQNLRTADGCPLRIMSPGWWNRADGPDFRAAQIEFDGRLRTGDVEIHLAPAGWRQHGHHLDARYDEVILHVVLDGADGDPRAVTASGRPVPWLALRPHLEEDIEALAERIDLEPAGQRLEGTFGRCAGIVEAYGSGRLIELLHLAGEWRMLFKARTLRERMDRAGPDQAVYESVLAACGFAHFKQHFQAVARALPYERARQLAQEDAALLEAALMQIAGLLPHAPPKSESATPHYARLRGLRNARLEGLRPLPLEWRRVGVRPINYPERRMAGVARFISRTASAGLISSLDDLWGRDERPPALRKAFESLFPGTTGFWASHCTWDGKKMTRLVAPLGPGRVRSIIGNVFIPLGLALARQRRDRVREERVLEFFAALPQEPDNYIHKVMVPRLFGAGPKPRLDFRTQQGLLQMFRDWCEPNPSCRNCSVIRGLAAEIAPGPGADGRTA